MNYFVRFYAILVVSSYDRFVLIPESDGIGGVILGAFRVILTLRLRDILLNIGSDILDSKGSMDIRAVTS